MKTIHIVLIALYYMIIGVFCGWIIFRQKEPCPKEMHEYQVELDFDTVRVYDNGRYVDCYIIGETLNAFDEIMAVDNR